VTSIERTGGGEQRGNVTSGGRRQRGTWRPRPSRAFRSSLNARQIVNLEPAPTERLGCGLRLDFNGWRTLRVERKYVPRALPRPLEVAGRRLAHPLEAGHGMRPKG
jgi:hypothetical protein